MPGPREQNTVGVEQVALPLRLPNICPLASAKRVIPGARRTKAQIGAPGRYRILNGGGLRRGRGESRVPRRACAGRTSSATRPASWPVPSYCSSGMAARRSRPRRHRAMVRSRRRRRRRMRWAQCARATARRARGEMDFPKGEHPVGEGRWGGTSRYQLSSGEARSGCLFRGTTLLYAGRSGTVGFSQYSVRRGA